MNLVCISVVLLSGLIQKISSLISCYHCANTTVDLCGNKTITCRYPADACYILFQDGTRMSRSCIWTGHCTPKLLCRGNPACDLHCCYDGDFCNRERKRDFSYTDLGEADWLVLGLLSFMLLCILVWLSRKAKSYPIFGST